MRWPEELIFMKNSRLPQKESQASMEGKTTIITGATSGVGLVTAKRLAEAKSNLILVCRNEQKALPIKDELVQKYQVNVDIVVADFSRLDDVRKAASYINNHYKRIDVLINSVGIHSTKKLMSDSNVELCFMVNHLSTFLFTKLLLPLMIKSAPSRIIQVNSEGHRFSSVKLKDINFRKRIYTGLKGYGQSKTAQLLSVIQLNEELKNTKVTINSCHPGAVKTNIGSNNGFLYRFFFKHVTSHFLKDPIISAKALHYLASDPELNDVSGKFFNLTIDELPAKHARNVELSQKVYDLSLKMVGLKDES